MTTLSIIKEESGGYVGHSDAFSGNLRGMGPGYRS
jgi:fructose 1,6-bisphosphatase